MASKWKLPVIYACENNSYAQYTKTSDVTADRPLGLRAQAFGIPVTEMYGQEVYPIYETMVEVVNRVRQGGGPEYVEFKTYRYGGHHVGDPGKEYRPADEIEEWKTHRRQQSSR